MASSLYILSRIIFYKQRRESKQGKQLSIVRREVVGARLRPNEGEGKLSVRDILNPCNDLPNFLYREIESGKGRLSVRDIESL